MGPRVTRPRTTKRMSFPTSFVIPAEAGIQEDKLESGSPGLMPEDDKTNFGCLTLTLSLLGEGKIIKFYQNKEGVRTSSRRN